MAAGKEIKRLRETPEKKVSVAKAASLIGIDSERLRKWEQKDIDPYDSSDVDKIETYFGVPLHKLKDLDKFQFLAQGSYSMSTKIRMSNQPIQDQSERIKELKEYNEALKKINEGLEKRLNMLETNLSEIRASQAVLLALLRETATQAAFYRYGTNKKKLDSELNEINKFVGAVHK